MFKKCDVRLACHQPHNKLTRYGFDNSDTKTYKFNSFGFRGEEYDSKAKKKIFVCGCSHSFGVGLDLEETWPYHFKKLLCKKENIDLNDINLLNFSVGGGSNDYITRILLTQANIIKPDLIMVYFSHAVRTEFVDEKGIKMIGPWGVNSSSENLENISLDNSVKGASLNYYSYLTDELAFINALKNILLLQYFCKTHKIDYIFIFEDIDKLSEKRFISNPICKQFIGSIDRKHLCDSKLKNVDFATDNAHCGPMSNKIFAGELFKFYEDKIAKK